MSMVWKLFNPDGFMPRRLCGQWTPGLIALHQNSDLTIWACYMAIPFLIWWGVRRYRAKTLVIDKLMRFVPALLVEAGMFVFFCGVTHLHQFIVFYYPVYRWIGVWSAATAAVSFVTVLTMAASIAMSIPTPGSGEKFHEDAGNPLEGP